MDLCLASEALDKSPRRYLAVTDLENSDLIDAATVLKSQPPFLRSAPGIHFNRTRTEPGTKAALDLAAVNHRVRVTPGDRVRWYVEGNVDSKRQDEIQGALLWEIGLLLPGKPQLIPGGGRISLPPNQRVILPALHFLRKDRAPAHVKAKRKSFDEVLAHLRRGDGQGEGATFRPYFHVRDVPSQGRSAIDLGIKTGRLHHYLSDIEYAYFLLAEFSIFVRAIREQYALLPWNETLKIALSYGIAQIDKSTLNKRRAKLAPQLRCNPLFPSGLDFCFPI